MLIRNVLSQNVYFRKFIYPYISKAKYSDGCSGDTKDLTRKDKGPDPAPPSPTVYDMRKYGHNLPCDSVRPCFEPLFGIPTGVFRCTDGECLGRGAYKCSYYQNPEYFSYHHMSFYDFHLILSNCRQPRPLSGRKK